MDRLPPHAPDAESAIIGCCLSFPTECVPECQKIITSEEFFYDHRSRVVWNLLCELPIQNVNIITVTERLRSKNLLDQIGMEYLSDCQDKGIGASFLSGWLEDSLEKYILRQLIQKCADITTMAISGAINAAAILDRAERDILAIRIKRADSLSIKELVREALFKIEQRCEKGDAITGLTTGLIDLDKKTDGLHGGEMIVVGGFPSTGKTALAVNIAVTNALAGVPVAIYSAEMRPVQLVVRSICSESKVNFHRANFNDASKFLSPSGKISKSPLHIEPASGLTIGQVMASARRLKQKHGIRLIVVDYIQLLAATGDNREQEIANISKGIKAMSLELDCAVLALSQLTDDGKLRESRAIGQHTDSIWKLENDGDWKPEIQPVKLHVEKCRDGETGTVQLIFHKTITRFESASKVEEGDYQHD